MTEDLWCRPVTLVGFLIAQDGDNLNDVRVGLDTCGELRIEDDAEGLSFGLEPELTVFGVALREGETSARVAEGFFDMNTFVKKKPLHSRLGESGVDVNDGLSTQFASGDSCGSCRRVEKKNRGVRGRGVHDASDARWGTTREKADHRNQENGDEPPLPNLSGFAVHTVLLVELSFDENCEEEEQKSQKQVLEFLHGSPWLAGEASS